VPRISQIPLRLFDNPFQRCSALVIMVIDENMYSGGELSDNLWLSAAKESLKLCRKCCGLAKQRSILRYLLSQDGLQFRTDVEYVRESARRGCPFCSVVFGKLNYDLKNTPELQALRKRSPRIFSRNFVRRQTRTYRPGNFLHLRLRAPWNDFSGKNEPWNDDFEELQMHYKLPKQITLGHDQKEEKRWKRLLEFDVCAINGKHAIKSRPKNWTNTSIGDVMAGLVSSRPLTENPGSEESFRQAEQWIKECCANHGSCPKPGSTLPTRVVDVGELGGDQGAKLFISKDGTAPYTALSYCWGEPPLRPQPPQPVMTTTTTIDDFTKGLPVSLLPRTIRDAIHTTRQLGFRYLWVDVLCILQDDKVDKRREIRKMKEIFSNAIVTISAACSESCHKGFLYQRHLYKDSFYHRSRGTKPPYVSVEYPPFLLPFRCPDGRLGSLILHRWMTTRPGPEPIDSRAWTLEERLLSPRVLMYTSTQVLWECQDRMKMQGSNIFESISQPRLKQMLFENNQLQFNNSESGTALIPNVSTSEERIDPQEGSKIEELRESWIDILTDYTARKMTLAEDRLLAISGIAAVFAKGFDTSQYKAGIWFTKEQQNFFLIDLLWHVVARKPVQSTHYARPSWSWAAIERGVNWHRDGSHAYARSKNSMTCKILDCSVELDSPDSPFGNVKSGTLKISGPLKKFKTIASESYSRAMKLDAQGERFRITTVLDSNGTVVPSFPAFLDTSTLEICSREDGIEISTVWALLLLKNMGLLILPVEEGNYRRVGIFFWNDDEPWFDEGELLDISTVTIN
jgi:hypothetical protein